MNRKTILTVLFLALMCSAAPTWAQTTGFTYQGKLTDNNTPPMPLSGNYDFQFKLFDALSGGAQQGTTQTLTNIAVDKGIFTVSLDFGACPTCFNGAARFLDISVRAAGGGAFTQLAPRQPLTATPYSMKSLNATTADGLSVACVNCITSGQIQSVSGSQVTGNIAGSQITGTIPVASVPAGSANYIQNLPATPQSGAGFNITSGHFSGGVRIEGSGFIVPDTPSLSLASTGSVKVDAPFLPGGRFTILENGNVGIGNEAPIDKLHIISGTTAVRVGTPNGADGMEIQSSAAGHSPAIYLTHTGTGGRKYRIASYGDNTNPGSFVIRDETTGKDRLIIDHLGKFRLRGGGGSLSEGLSFDALSGGASGISTEDLGNLAINLGINTGKEGTFITTSPGFWLNLDTRPGLSGFHFLKKAATSGAVSELMTIHETGSVGIGKNVPNDKLDVDGDIRVGTGFTGCVKDADGTMIAGTCSSDARLKRDITPFPNLLDQLVRLKPVHFYWRNEEFKDRHFGLRQSYGLIAQEVEQVMPELVSEDQQGYKAVNYAKLPLLTLQAVKQLKQENEALKQRLEQQQKQMDALKKLVCLDHPEAEMCKR